MTSNPAPGSAAGAADVLPLSAEGSLPDTVRRFSPLVALIAVALLSLGTWAAIWVAVASLVPR